MAQKPTLRQLKYLCSVADEHHFGNAAKACHVTQSTLSAGIQELEAALGIALAPMSGVAFLLTEDIRTIYPFFGSQLAPIVLSMVAVLGLLGPLAVQWGLRYAGESRMGDR